MFNGSITSQTHLILKWAWHMSDDHENKLNVDMSHEDKFCGHKVHTN